jgi:hypothetical protein
MITEGAVPRDVRKSLFIFGLYPQHPEVFLNTTRFAAPAADPDSSFSALSHRVVAGTPEVYEYLFCVAERDFFWDIPRLPDQIAAVAVYWERLQEPILQSVAINARDLRMPPSQSNLFRQLYTSLIVDQFHNFVVETPTRREVAAIVDFLVFIRESSGWKGPFLAVTDDLSPWRNALDKTDKLRVLRFLCNSKHRDLLKDFAFPAFDKFGKRIPDAVQYNIVLTTPKVFEQQLEFFTSVRWQIGVNWSDTALDLTSQFTIMRGGGVDVPREDVPRVRRFVPREPLEIYVIAESD